MIKIIHRVNKVEELKKIPKEYGVEVDVRSRKDKLILHHDSYKEGELLEDYLAHFQHAFIILEIKEEGIEKKVIKLCKKKGIENYFLLSVSFPFMHLLAKEGITKMAVRFSEFEDKETCLALKNKVDWVWVDTFTKNPLEKNTYQRFKDAGFKLCLVSPERWGRTADIKKEIVRMEKQGIKLDAVLTSLKESEQW